MSDAGTVTTTVATATAVAIGGNTLLGTDLTIWVGAVSGVAFFMLQSTDRNMWQRIALFAPSAAGTTFAADAISSYFSLHSRMTPILAFIIGLVIVILSSAWIRKAGGRGFLSSAFNWVVDRMVAMRGKR